MPRHSWATSFGNLAAASTSSGHPLCHPTTYGNNDCLYCCLHSARHSANRPRQAGIHGAGHRSGQRFGIRWRKARLLRSRRWYFRLGRLGRWLLRLWRLRAGSFRSGCCGRSKFWTIDIEHSRDAKWAPGCEQSSEAGRAWKEAPHSGVAACNFSGYESGYRSGYASRDAGSPAALMGESWAHSKREPSCLRADRV